MASQPTSDTEKPLLIVAIDFGTSCSGASFALSHKVSKRTASRQTLTSKTDSRTLSTDELAFGDRSCLCRKSANKNCIPAGERTSSMGILDRRGATKVSGVQAGS